MHGAIRKTGFGPVPERLASHLYHIGHNNPKGYLQRDSISCRRTNRNSPSAHFAPGFDGDGMPMARTGFHVPCQTQADCMACGRHPLTGQVRAASCVAQTPDPRSTHPNPHFTPWQYYVCQKRTTLYDTVRTTKHGGIDFLNLTDGSSNSFDIDMHAGAITGRTGVCVDLDSSMNEGCNEETVAKVKDGVVGCMDAFVSQFLCGLALEVRIRAYGPSPTLDTKLA